MDSLDEGKICCKSYIFKLNKNHAIDKINWISLMRLYKFTCKEAGFELSPAQPCHHPSVKKRYNSNSSSSNGKLEKIVGSTKN